MKKHYLAIGAITATTLLAGCDLGDMIGLNNSSEKSEHTTSQSNQPSNKTLQIIIKIIPNKIVIKVQMIAINERIKQIVISTTYLKLKSSVGFK